VSKKINKAVFKSYSRVLYAFEMWRNNYKMGTKNNKMWRKNNKMGTKYFKMTPKNY